MLEILQKSNRYQKELLNIKERIDKVHIDLLRQDLNLLLKKLMAEVESLDKHHLGLLENARLPNMIDQTRENIVDLRKKIFRKLEDYEKSLKD